MPREVGEQYKKILKKYITNQSEVDLYAGQNFSKQFIEKEISPEDLISIHKTAVEEMVANLPTEVPHSFDFLIEMMIHYGLALKEHQSLLKKQEEHETELTIAAKVQDTLLKTKIPNIKGLDIGLLSVPAEKISGDYIYFMDEKENFASVAVADVIGKGIPAALCMSMIKFGMDSLHNGESCPHNVLDVVNRIVEKSVDDSMFISMFYGKYDARNSVFLYSSAGHEPALLYKASKGIFIKLDAKGLLLGVKKNVIYEENSVVLEEGDFIAMMTDGVTEVRTEEGFIDEFLIESLLSKVKDNTAQQMVDSVFKELEQMQNFELRDDFTIVIFKKDEKV
ncbi:PP2C family protein-serine/threonine phosphatase [Sporosarcina siberiensis]|uniref:PP2C family protein-serine/threonine phosphatase n=1 Tax=Sporosarcina siberiensis TaxID=1365606 RepID=A0ABW4SFV2_9BACL